MKKYKLEMPKKNGEVRGIGEWGGKCAKEEIFQQKLL